MEWADKKGRIDMMDNGNWSEQYSMENIIGCEYNMDNGYVEVYYSDGNILQLKCEEIEANLHTTEQSLAKLHKLLDDKPIEYVGIFPMTGRIISDSRHSFPIPRVTRYIKGIRIGRMYRPWGWNSHV